MKRTAGEITFEPYKPRSSNGDYNDISISFSFYGFGVSISPISGEQTGTTEGTTGSVTLIPETDTDLIDVESRGYPLEAKMYASGGTAGTTFKVYASATMDWTEKYTVPSGPNGTGIHYEYLTGSYTTPYSETIEVIQ